MKIRRLKRVCCVQGFDRMARITDTPGSAWWPKAYSGADLNWRVHQPLRRNYDLQVSILKYAVSGGGNSAAR